MGNTRSGGPGNRAFRGTGGSDKNTGIAHPERLAGEDDRDFSLRPRELREFLGQAAMKENLAVFIAAAKARNESLDHLFLIGPPGLGKTTLAQVVAHELGVDFKVTSAPALDKPKDLAGILTTVTEKTVFFIDEIHRLKPAIEEMLYIAMEDYELDWIIGQGPSARTIRIPIPPFTLVGATTKAGNVSSPLISRFGITCRFSFYEQGDMEAIVRRSAGILRAALAIITEGRRKNQRFYSYSLFGSEIIYRYNPSLTAAKGVKSANTTY